MEIASNPAANAEEDLLKRRPSAVIALATVAFTVGIAATGSSESAAQNGRIAWKSFARVDSTWSIYAANPDGSSRRRLTHPAAGVHDDLPDWSPDGSHILFDRIFQPETNSTTIADEVMRINADGTGLRQIGRCTGDCVVDDDPQYSPDGHQIVYTRLMHVQPRRALVLGVWVMDAGGTNPRQITQLSAPANSEDHEPAWSPDGKKIVFTRLNDTATPANQQALFIVSSSGGEPRRITNWTLNAGGANWSPDGSRILFSRIATAPAPKPRRSTRSRRTDRASHGSPVPARTSSRTGRPTVRRSSMPTNHRPVQASSPTSGR